MLPPKRLGRFFLCVAVVYAIFMAPWPGLREAYAALFRGTCNIVFARYWIWTDGGVRFLDLDALQPGDLAPGAPAFDAVGTYDTLMELRSRRAPGSIGYLRISSRYVGYGTTVVLLSLILATPLPRGRKLWALFWGGLLIHAFIALRITLTLAAEGFSAEKNYALFAPGPFWRGVLTRAETVLSDDPTVSFVVPVIIWFVVALRYVERTDAKVRAVSPEPGPTPENTGEPLRSKRRKKSRKS